MYMRMYIHPFYTYVIRTYTHVRTFNSSSQLSSKHNSTVISEMEDNTPV